MKSNLAVKMLPLVLLVSSVTDGRTMNKCELKAKLEAAQFQDIMVMGEKLSGKDLVARLACKAKDSGFNTNFMKTISVYHEDDNSNEKDNSIEKDNSNEEDNSNEDNGPPRSSTSTLKAPPQNLPQAPPQTPTQDLSQDLPTIPPEAPPQNLPQAPPQTPTQDLSQGLP
ncbi:arp2/3 complex-activating protein rickA-like [Labeo rohita]|uniref:arp2/3 complex-activating protein rickA-like n=1 Tax=Labeo rohita TaxID=84645 RepID=UPI0021E2848C|nr:arp2/3 complex-activating protein rickA-like [Labeo rohita]